MKVIIINNAHYELVDLNTAIMGNSVPERSFIEFGTKFYPIFYNTMPEANNPKHGVYIVPGLFYRIVTDNSPEWELSSYQVLDFNAIQSMVDMYEKNNQIDNILAAKLIPDAGDNIYYHEIQNDESSLMVALQMFMNAKQVNPLLYSDRIKNYANTIRILNKKEVSHNKFMEFMDAFDGKVTITIENRDDNCPNPISSPIVVEL